VAEKKKTPSYVKMLRESAREQVAESAAAASARAARQRSALERQRQAAKGQVRVAARKEGRKAVLPGYWGTAKAREEAMWRERAPEIEEAVVEVGGEIAKGREEEMEHAEKAITEWEEERMAEFRKDNVELATGEWVSKEYLGRFVFGAERSALEALGTKDFGRWQSMTSREVSKYRKWLATPSLIGPSFDSDICELNRQMRRELRSMGYVETPEHKRLREKKQKLIVRKVREWKIASIETYKARIFGVRRGEGELLDDYRARVDVIYQQYLEAAKLHYDKTSEGLSMKDWWKSQQATEGEGG